MSRVVGVIVDIFRYPVKTMQGERLEVAYVGSSGILGDRAYAVALQEEKIGERKDFKKYSRLIGFRAEYVEEPRAGYIPPAKITTPSGESFLTSDPYIDDKLSREFNMPVKLIKMVDKPFHDSHPIHIVTTSSILSINKITGLNDFHKIRFRPNIVVETRDAKDFPEDLWVGNRVRIGAGVELFVKKRCRRCFVTSLPQQGLGYNPKILEYVERLREGYFGVNCYVVREGVIREGDEVVLV